MQITTVRLYPDGSRIVKRSYPDKAGNSFRAQLGADEDTSCGPWVDTIVRAETIRKGAVLEDSKTYAVHYTTNMISGRSYQAGIVSGANARKMLRMSNAPFRLTFVEIEPAPATKKCKGCNAQLWLSDPDVCEGCDLHRTAYTGCTIEHESAETFCTVIGCEIC